MPCISKGRYLGSEGQGQGSTNRLSSERIDLGNIYMNSTQFLLKVTLKLFFSYLLPKQPISAYTIKSSTNNLLISLYQHVVSKTHHLQLPL